MSDELIYLDNGDTTKIDDEVLEYMLEFYKTSYGNPASLHQLGIDADENLSEARQKVSSFINCNGDDLIFTSGATESNNLAINGVANFYKDKGKHIIISTIEHSSVREVARRLIKSGYELTEIGVDSEGFLDIDLLEKSIRPDTILVSIIYANYEIGTIQQIENIGKICRDKGVFFHSDAAQAFGKIKIDVIKENIDLLTFNAHKMHGPKGVGALYIRKGISLSKMFEGGAHERGIRPGTENLPAIMGFAKAAEIAYRDFDKIDSYVCGLRDLLATKLSEIDHIFYNGPKGEHLVNRLSNNVDFTFQFIEGEAIMLHLTLRGICVSSGSACSSKTLEPSHVLTAIGLKHEQAHGSIRFTLSKYTTEDDVLRTAKNVKEVVEILRNMSSFNPEVHSELNNENAVTFYKR
ncbi:MAG: cysteine desulfurase [Candidatus Delongbacteria bacterium]|nr:cysteine desulfurase [Candidatus Delongbacteria bacterium]MBN2834190.1 cysteine desulfurase [Candidatus Delongbacteria bacterium]